MNNQTRKTPKKKEKSDQELLELLNTEFPGYPASLLSFTQGNDPKETGKTIENLKNFVRKTGKDISTSQVRNLYSKARAVKNESQLQLLRPQIAYMVARQQATGQPYKRESMRKFFLLLDDLISKGISLPDFLKIFEAIVAYHKYFGEKN
ncbi:MAG: CRISPR-associated protein Csm2 [Anaerophaga sp.]|uniref:type III-A CRISPR-associated protein Csm2 n=1 Tax=Anaerophaga thermohalophila TaxID=177400 RepID=UPI000237C8EA|nr:type III-A CRISPR-associated protein Csm2 [Anaerophaga thermohalophila]MDI3521696.1 CRISPR-associated protein Csm2 [Anaerophaga sp.]MDN5290820.1 CRISPR-associated protein Csm2 [Anaerophaga sp.]